MELKTICAFENRDKELTENYRLRNDVFLKYYNLVIKVSAIKW